MMFTVLGYQLEDADVAAALATVRVHLEPGGLFVFDVWNGSAVLADQPGERRVSVTDRTAHITRKTGADLDIERHLIFVTFDFERIDADGRTEEWQEEHIVRYFFPQELELALRQNQLDLLQLCGFPDSDAPADERAWNVVGVARAE